MMKNILDFKERNPYLSAMKSQILRTWTSQKIWPKGSSGRSKYIKADLVGLTLIGLSEGGQVEVRHEFGNHEYLIRLRYPQEP